MILKRFEISSEELRKTDLDEWQQECFRSITPIYVFGPQTIRGPGEFTIVMDVMCDDKPSEGYYVKTIEYSTEYDMNWLVDRINKVGDKFIQLMRFDKNDAYFGNELYSATVLFKKL